MQLKQEIRVLPVKLLRDVRPGDRLHSLILRSLVRNNIVLKDGDIIVIAQKIVSKTEGQIINLSSLTPTTIAIQLAKKYKKDPRIIELILRQSKKIVKISNGIIISETKHGFICANAGVDQSNIMNSGEAALLLPDDPDASARKVMHVLKERTNREIAVIITDSFGRPFRNGQTNVAIGVAGINPIRSYVGEEDMYGKKLKVTEIAVVDELASTAELVMGKSKGIPIAVIRGFEYVRNENAVINGLIREREKDLFR